MTPEELRIGNYVECDGCIAKVKVIDSRTHDVLVWKLNGQEWCGKIEKLKPLHICERIALSCKQFREGEIAYAKDDYDRVVETAYFYGNCCFEIEITASYDLDGEIGGNDCYFDIINLAIQNAGASRIESTDYDCQTDVHFLQNLSYYYLNEELEFDETELSKIPPICYTSLK